MDEVVVAAGPGGEVAEHEAEGGADEADEEALQQEDAAHLAGLDAEAHHDGDVAGLLHDHHGEGDEDVERGDENNERDDDEGDDLLLFERREELAVLLYPIICHVAFAGGLLDLLADFRRAVQIVDFEADDGEQVGFAEEALGVGEAEKAHLRVVLIKAGVEGAGEAEADDAGHHADRGHLALGADEHDGVAHGCADGFGQVLAEDDGRHFAVGGAGERLEGLDRAGRGGF